MIRLILPYILKLFLVRIILVVLLVKSMMCFLLSIIQTYLIMNLIIASHVLSTGLKFLVRLCTDLGLKDAQEYATKLKKAEKAQKLREEVCISFTHVLILFYISGETNRFQHYHKDSYQQIFHYS